MSKRTTKSNSSKMTVERVQTGVRLEKRLLKVLKGVAEASDVSLGELLEGIALHALEREHAFMPDMLPIVKKLKDVYGMDYDIHAYEKWQEA